MATFRERLPAKQDLVRVFAACAFPIYSWAIFQFLERMTGWLYYLSIWEVLGIFAYTQVFALFETGVIFAGLTLLAWLLPPSLFRRRFVAVGMIVIVLAAAFAIVLHYQEKALRALSPPLLAVIAAAAGVVSLAAYLWVRGSERIEQALCNLGDRLILFVYIYVPLSLVSIVVILVRNIL